MIPPQQLQILNKNNLNLEPNYLDSGVQLSVVAETMIDNYSIYHQEAEKLRLLQKWVIDQLKIINDP